MELWENWLQQRKNIKCHRQLVVLSGSREWTYNHALAIAQTTGKKSLWMGNNSFFTVRGFPTKQYKKLLGQECHVGVYDAHSDISPSAYLALAGTITAGGICIICCPEWDKWTYNVDHINRTWISRGFHIDKSAFISRWQSIMEADGNCIVIREDHVEQSLPVSKADVEPEPDLSPFASKDQKETFENITCKKSFSNCVITARRGRGKSVLLGMLANHFAQLGRTVTFCSAVKSNAEKALSQSNSHKKIEWVAPDNPKLTLSTDLLLIDEAANLPVAQLLEIINHCKNFILATTTEGYEGTGRGFNAKLLPKLQQKFDDLQEYSMCKPIRYYASDTLEQINDKAFFLDTAAFSLSGVSLELKECSFNLYETADQLLQNANADIFSLLAFAHYQTTPEDILRIIDAPDTYVAELKYGSELIGTAVICEEGNYKLDDLAVDIAQGTRRAQGHLFSQKIALSLSSPEFLKLKNWRINRIAVHPHLRARGVGSLLLKRITETALNQGVNMLSASFGGTPGTLAFWRKNGFLPVHVGASADKTTGETSVFVLKQLANAHSYSLPTIEQLNQLLLFDIQNTDAELLLADFVLNNDRNSHTQFIHTITAKRIRDYVNETRSYLHLGNSITYWLELNSSNLAGRKHLNSALTLLNAKWIDKKSDADILSNFKIRDRKKLYKLLHEYFQTCYWESAMQ